MSQVKQKINNFMSERKGLNNSIPDSVDLVNEIMLLKNKKKAVILAHYYQNSEIQELSDYLGDSLYLAQCAKKVTSDIIVLAGVHFMGETAKIINPKKKVLVPDLKAGCSLSDSCPPDEFKKYIGNYPDHNVVTYINCSAEIKSLSTIVCTSSNAKKVINSIPENEKIIFAPDKNLGKYLIKETGRDMKLWNGSCIVHEAFSLEKIIDLIKKYPQAKFIAHPESESPVLEIANFIASAEPCTSDLIIIFSSSVLFLEKALSFVAKLKFFISSLASLILASDKFFASFSEDKTTKSSPAFEAPFIPKTSTGVDGSAFSIF